MYIDLHCHTRNAKSSDSTREVDSSTFLNTMKRYGVGIVGITNHNLFDYEQYKSFSMLDENIQVWPGIELDVIGNKSGRNCRGHVIVISNPKYVDNFQKFVDNIVIIGGTNPDDFIIDIDDFVKIIRFVKECLIICHYKKNPELSIDDISFIKSSVNDEKLVILEPSNARKAAIIFHQDSEQAWFGSDVINWADYPSANDDFKLPNTKFKINSFENFFFLLKKNRGAVLENGYLDPKKSDVIPITLFGDLNFNYQIFNDINLIFGGKATAKTSILRQIEQYYISKSKVVSSFYVENKDNDLKCIVNKKPSDSCIKKFNQDSCSSEIAKIKNWKWSSLPSLSTFYKSELYSQKSALVAKLGIFKASFTEPLDKNELDSNCEKLLDKLSIVNNFSDLSFDKYISEEETKLLTQLIDKIKKGIDKDFYELNFDYYSKYLEKWSITKIKDRIAAADTVIAKPISTGFLDFYNDYEDILRIKNTITEKLQAETVISPFPVIGRIPLKGNVYRKLCIGIKPQKPSQYKSKTGGDRIYLYSQNKKNYDSFVKVMKELDLSDNCEIISTKIQEIKNVIQDYKLNSLLDFLNYSNILVTDNSDDFLPSNGVTSVLLVESALSNDGADVYILDEPDSGMGADFVNYNLIPEILKKSDENKTVIIATHDPNIVVRTHPYSCVYREEVDNNVYKTYIGSSFDDELINVNDNSEPIRFVEACIKKCEGGEKAFDERMTTYGKW